MKTPFGVNIFFLFLKIGSSNMIPYLEFCKITNAKKPASRKQIKLSTEQLFVLHYLKEEFQLTDIQTQKLEYIVTRECRIISQDRYKKIKFLEICLGAVAFIFDLDAKDWKNVTGFINTICKDDHSSYDLTISAYHFYRNYYNTFFGLEFPDDLTNFSETLRLR
jgi:hypothetical protein